MSTAAAVQLANKQIFIPIAITVDGKDRPKSVRLANAMAIELMNYGIEVDPEIIQRISRHKKKPARAFCDDILKMFTIGDVNPPLFPYWEERTDFSFREFVIQIFGYMIQLSGNDLEDPNYMAGLRERVQFKKIHTLSLGTDSEAVRRLCELLTSSVALDRASFKTLVSLAKHFPHAHLDRNIRSDESRIAVLAGMVSASMTLADAMTHLDLRPADVMRYLAFRQDFAGVKLPADVKYANATWSERLTLVRFLDSFDLDVLCEAMGNNRNAWSRFYNHIHLIGQSAFVNRFPKVVAAACLSLGSKMDAIPRAAASLLGKHYDLYDVTESGNLAYRTFASRIASAVEAKDFDQFEAAIRSKPSYLFRNLASLSHIATKANQSRFVELARELIGRTNVSVLLSLVQIDVNAKYRIIDSKGNTTVTEADYHPVIAELQGLAERELYRRHGMQGQIAVSKELEDKVVPFLSTNAELDRGSRIPFDNAKYLYFLIHWVQNKHRTDLDHSYGLMSGSGEELPAVYFGNQANAYITQSGDITNAPGPNGATEYGRIDLNAIPANVRYIVPFVNVYCGELFAKCKTAYAGFMFSDSDTFQLSRKHVRYDLSQPAHSNVPFVIDVHEREILIVDFNNRQMIGRTIHGSFDEIKMIIEAMKTKRFMTIGRFAKMLSGDDESTSLRIRKRAQRDGEIEPDQLHTLVSRDQETEDDHGQDHSQHADALGHVIVDVL